MNAETSEGTVTWKEDVGLELNFNAGAPTNKVYILPPEKFTIVATTEFNSWNNSRYMQMPLESGDISINLGLI